MPLPQQWVDAAKRNDRAEMEYILAQSEAELVCFEAPTLAPPLTATPPLSLSLALLLPPPLAPAPAPAPAQLVHHKARGIGHTAMHWAAVQGDRGMMAWLLSLGAAVDSRNNSEATPLHAAASNGQAMSVTFLLGHGADARLANDDGETAVQLAAKQKRVRGSDDIEREIRAHLDKLIETDKEAP